MSLDTMMSLDERVREGLAIFYFAQKLGFSLSKGEIGVAFPMGQQFGILFKRRGHAVVIGIAGPMLSQHEFDDLKAAWMDHARELEARKDRVDHRINHLWESSRFKADPKAMDRAVLMLMNGKVLNPEDVHV